MTKNEVKVNVRFDASLETAQMEKGIKSLGRSMSKLNLAPGMEKELDKALDRITKRLNEIKDISADGVLGTQKDTNQVVKAYDEVAASVRSIAKIVNGMDTSKLTLKDGQQTTKQLAHARKQLEGMASAATDVNKKLSKTLESMQSGSKGVKKAFQGLNLDRLAKNMAKGSTDASINKRLSDISKDAKKAAVELKNAEQVLEDLQKRVANRQPFEGETLGQLKDRVKVQGNTVNKLKATSAELDTIEKHLTDIKSLVQTMQKQHGGLTQLGDDSKETKSSVSALETEVQRLENEIEAGLTNAISECRQETQQLVQTMDTGFTQAIQDAEKLTNEMHDMGTEMQEVTDNVMQFFSVANGFQLIGNAARSAMEDIKELDAAMTDIAVVTDMDLDEVWDMFEMWSDQASEMGAATIDMVNATKLYYQQGLSTQEAMTAAIETIEMARIAGIEGAYATDLMTAALQGFKMEVDEAARVNDVYSALAAASASDTQEIAEAMSRTASIADSAGSSFESTAAFLTQMIETTRESPENLGTALKTIIARFQELKKAPGEIGMVEGEYVDANAIETALKDVGIALKDAEGNFRDFDDVIMEISKSWDTMTQMQQRYIATVAAGSRQQSRFIALVSDYERLLELVTIATNSAGAANEQYEKTLDSLEAKMNSFRNELSNFLLGLFPVDAIKAGLDILTKVLEVINNIMNLGPEGGIHIVDWATSAALAVGFFVGLKKLVSGFLTYTTGEIMHMQAKIGATGTKAMVDVFDQRFKKGKLSDAMIDEFETTKSWFNKERWFAEGTYEGQKKELGELAEAIDEVARIEAIGLGEGNRDYDNALQDRALALENVGRAYNATAEDMEMFNTLSRDFGMERATVFLAENAEDRASTMAEIHRIQQLQGITTAERNRQIGLILSAQATHMGIITKMGHKMKLAFSGDQGRRLQSQAALGLDDTNRLVKGFGKSGVRAGVAISAITAGVTALAVAFSRLQNMSLDNQLQEAGESVSVAASALDSANQSVENLDTSIETYNELAAELDTLVVGTAEWEKALIEVNNQILQMLDSFPELAAYVTTGEYGELVIEEGGLENQAQIEAQNAASAQYNLAIQTMREQELIQLQAYDQASDQAEEAGVGYADFEAVLAAYEDNAMLFEESNEEGAAAMEELAKQTGQTTKTLYSLEEIVQGLAQTTAETTAGVSAQAQTAALMLAPEGFAGTTQGDAIIQAWAESIEDNASANLDEALSDYTKRAVRIGEMEGKYDLEKLASDLGIAFEESDKWGRWGEQEEIEQMYLEVTGLSEIPAEFENDYEKMVEQMVAVVQGEDITEQMEGFEEHMAGVNKQVAENIAAMLSTEGESLTKEMMNMVGETMSMEELDEIAQMANFEDAGALAEQFGMTADQLVQTVNDNIISARAAFEESEQLMLEAGAGEVLSSQAWAQITEKETAATVEALANDIANAYATEWENLDEETQAAIEASGADSAGQYFAESIAKLLDEALSKGQDVYDDTITALATTDFTSEQSISILLDDLAASGLITQESMVELEAIMIDVNEASKKLTTEGMASLNDAVTSLMEGLQQGTQGRTIDKATYDTLVSYSPDMASQFTMDSEGNMTYIGQDVQAMYDSLYAGWMQMQADVSTMTGEDGKLLSVEEQAQQRAINAQEAATTMTMSQLQGATRQAVQFGVTTGADVSQELQAYTNAAILLGREVGNCEAEVRAFELAVADLAVVMQNGTEEEKRAAIQTAHLAGQNLDAAMSYQSLAKSTEEYAQSTLDAATATQNAAVGTAEYDMYLNQLVSSANAMFQVNLPAEFWALDEVQRNLIASINGDTEAYYALTQSMAYAAMYNRMLADGFIKGGQEMAAVAAALDSIVFTMEGYADVSQLVNALLTAGYTALEVAEIVEKLGFTNIQFSTETEMIPIETQWQDPAKGGATVTRTQYVEVPKSITAENVYQGGGGGMPAPYTPPPVPPPSTSSAPSSGGGSEPEPVEEAPWENPYDELYNLTEEINANLEERNELEWEYSQMLEDNVENTQAVVDNIEQQEANIMYQQELLQEKYDALMKQQAELEAESGLSGYARYDEKAGMVVIDWGDINAVTDAEKGAEIEEYISELESIASEIQDVEQAMRDNVDALEELSELGESEYFALEDRLFDALVAQREEEISALEEINTSINDANAALMEGLQTGVDAYRQERAQEEQLDSIAEMERQMALMGADTSGANDLEMLKLQEQLDQARQDYTDSLIDQTIQLMQEGNDVAADQRQQQIDLMHESLAYDQANGIIMQEVEDLIDGAIKDDGTLDFTAIEDLLKEFEGYDNMSNMGQAQWSDELYQQLEAAFAWYIKETTDPVSNPSTPSSGGSSGSSGGSSGSSGGGSGSSASGAIGEHVKATGSGNSASDGSGHSAAASNSGYIGRYISGAKYPYRMDNKKNGDADDALGWYQIDDLKEYKTGGLNTETGLAWLDGTRSKPELVLNAQETQNFLALKDILSQVMKGGSPFDGGTAPGGDAFYEIHIEVDKLTSDYDVEMLKDKIQDMITTSANYRNVNQLSMPMR